MEFAGLFCTHAFLCRAPFERTAKRQSYTPAVNAQTMLLSRYARLQKRLLCALTVVSEMCHTVLLMITRSLYSSQQHCWQNQCLKSLLPPCDGKRVVDMCAGSGRASLALLRAYPTAHATLVDSSLERLDRAQRRLRENGFENGECVLQCTSKRY